MSFFTINEFLHSDTAQRAGINNSIPQNLVPNLEKTMAMMERVRAKLGHPITISSGYRCPKLNAMVGGQVNSDHLLGFACDFVCPGFGTPDEIVKFLDPLRSELGFTQLIFEFSKNAKWVHISTNPATKSNTFTLQKK